MEWSSMNGTCGISAPHHQSHVPYPEGIAFQSPASPAPAAHAGTVAPTTPQTPKGFHLGVVCRQFNRTIANETPSGFAIIALSYPACAPRCRALEGNAFGVTMPIAIRAPAARRRAVARCASGRTSRGSGRCRTGVAGRCGGRTCAAEWRPSLPAAARLPGRTGGRS